MAKVKKRAVKKIAKKILRKIRRKVFVAKPKAKKIKISKKIKKLKPKVVKKVVRTKKPVRKVVKPIAKKVARKIVRPAKRIVKKTAKVVKISKRKKPVALARVESPEFSGEALFKAKIKVIGIGGGGGSIVSEIERSLQKATFVIADTDIRALKKRPGIKYFWFGEELTRGLGTGVNVELAKQAAQAAKEKISPIFKEQDIIIFVASLGGGLGSGATQVFAELAKHFGGITMGIFTMPFKFEGQNKQRIAHNALKILKDSLNVSLVIPNERIFKIIDESTPITSAFSTVNKTLIESLESLIDLIYNPGIINIDFADLRTILRGRGSTAFLNTVEESGKDRAEKVCENILKNPLLQNSGFQAEKILFNIAGAENLSMFEVEKISSHISNLNPKAKIIFGISKSAKLKNKIKTTILMTGGQTQKEKLAPEEAAAPKIIKELVKKQAEKPARNNAKALGGEKKQKANKKPALVSVIPVFDPQNIPVPVLEQRKLDIVQVPLEVAKKAIRRSALEIKKAEENEEKKRIAQEKEWEIPAFLRKVKFKS